ncbi:saccharopine dehydrogenase family protein [Pseudonocardia sichuanensis]
MERRGHAEPPRRVVVYGAYGHTGRFVTAELLRRGLVPILSGRDPERLAAFGADHPGLECRPATVDDPRVLNGAAAVINCAGPFLDTASPLAGAAVRAGVHYLDVSAEQTTVQALHREQAGDARAAGVAVVPAMAFYGGLADLLATSAMGDWTRADEITVAVALDRWWPTAGTRLTGRRNTARRLVVAGGRLVPLADPAPTRAWPFPEPFGRQETVELPFSEIVTMATHLRASAIHSFFRTGPLHDLRDPATPGPEAVDGTGRSAQRFVVEVVARRGTGERRITAAGRDIYAVSAPIVVEATVRILDGRVAGLGVAAPGELFDADDVLGALSPDPLTVTREW